MLTYYYWQLKNECNQESDVMTDLMWRYKHYAELNTNELYSILQARNAVFVVEQNCPYQDADDKDRDAYHLWGVKNEKLCAYVRILAPGVAFTEASIGRVLTTKEHRGEGAGKILMQHAIEKTFSQYNVSEIRIGAQLYLKRFYEEMGFKKISGEYLEDDIPHIEMLLLK